MPRLLFHKLIAQATIGLFFILIGCVYGIQHKDNLFVILSILLGICSMIRTYSFYHIIRNESYLILSGTCMNQESIPFKKTQQITFLDKEQREYVLTLNKNIKLLSGHQYQLYFQQFAVLDSGFKNYSSADFLGYEEQSKTIENCGT